MIKQKQPRSNSIGIPPLNVKAAKIRASPSAYRIGSLKGGPTHTYLASLCVTALFSLQFLSFDQAQGIKT